MSAFFSSMGNLAQGEGDAYSQQLAQQLARAQVGSEGAYKQASAETAAKAQALQEKEFEAGKWYLDRDSFAMPDGTPAPVMYNRITGEQRIPKGAVSTKSLGFQFNQLRNSLPPEDQAAFDKMDLQTKLMLLQRLNPYSGLSPVTIMGPGGPQVGVLSKGSNSVQPSVIAGTNQPAIKPGDATTTSKDQFGNTTTSTKTLVRPGGAGNGAVAPQLPAPPAPANSPLTYTDPFTNKTVYAPQWVINGAKNAVLGIKPSEKEQPRVTAYLASHPELGAATYAGINKPTVTTTNMAQLAATLIPHLNDISKQTDAVSKMLGPGAGRWNSLMTGQIGLDNPLFKSYMTNVGMLQTGVALAHARGRMNAQLFDHFQQLLDAGKTSPENMKAAIAEIGKWMQDYYQNGRGQFYRQDAAPGTAPPANAPVGGGKPAGWE